MQFVYIYLLKYTYLCPSTYLNEEHLLLCMYGCPWAWLQCAFLTEVFVCVCPFLSLPFLYICISLYQYLLSEFIFKYFDIWLLFFVCICINGPLNWHLLLEVCQYLFSIMSLCLHESVYAGTSIYSSVVKPRWEITAKNVQSPEISA